MPDGLRATHSANPTPTVAAHPYPLTPPAERDGDDENAKERESQWQTNLGNGDHVIAVDDNTAAGMSRMQEASMYAAHETNLQANSTDLQGQTEKEKLGLNDLCIAAEHQLRLPGGQTDHSQPSIGEPDRFRSVNSPDAMDSSTSSSDDRTDAPIQARDNEMADITPVATGTHERSAEDDGKVTDQRASSSSPSADEARRLNKSSIEWSGSESPRSKPWDFSHIPLEPHYPSSLLHPGSKFEGTQTSDRQIYSVTVTIHTIDIPQSSLSGYLKIEGLTPDHPTLTTFFTGEIIGGPNQRYSFQTKNPGWGATDKTDLMHWARFLAWKPLSREAKRDINFEYPVAGTGLNGNDDWWQQECIFMRWKEWFLVPDHRVRSIQGASFEGFYYICFNQIEGRISGIYFHARSEKYQQLELKHEGEKGIWNRGVRPSVEFR